ncbi:MAG: hypothetical protein O6761_01065 [Thaumarchaeota archaeon]|nr:hypothetical protein [Nitrososphaerota archaeon]GFN40099.1 MAG: conserved hypothetical protein [Marine Group I thaumarchaeote]
MLSSKTKGLIAAGASVIIITGILYGTGSSCGIEHVIIINDSQSYEDLDPESCEELVYRIIELNENCDTDIEILDCG